MSHFFKNSVGCEILLRSAAIGVVDFADFNTLSVNSMVGSLDLNVSI